MENQDPNVYNHPDENDGIQRRNNNPNNQNNVIAGLLIIILGVLVYLRNTEVFDGDIFRFIFSVPMLLMTIGLIVGVKNNFRNKGWLVLMIIGGFLLLQKLHINVGQFIFPVILIAIGLSIISKNKNRRQIQNQYADYNGSFNTDIVNVEALLGENNRIVQSQNFRGGAMSVIFGSSKLDCKQAILNADAVLNLTVFCGGAELIVPANWIIVNESTIVFGGIEDKRQMINFTGNEKKLLLKGTVICGGIDIKSF